jgi:hypothetical protein
MGITSADDGITNGIWPEERTPSTAIWQAAHERRRTWLQFAALQVDFPATQYDQEPQAKSQLPVCSLAQLRGCAFRAVLFSMVFGRFLGVVHSMESMSCSYFRMMRGLLMAAGFVMLRGLPVVFGCQLVMFGRLLVVFSALINGEPRQQFVPNGRHCNGDRRG